MTATDDRLTLHELKTFARECDDAADRLDSPTDVDVILTARASPQS